jgi:RES domain.
MKISDFANDSFLILPRSYKKDDFKTYLFKELDEFVNKLENLKSEINYFDDINFSIDSILIRQNHLVQKIKESLNDYYDGKPAKAFNSLNNGLSSNVKNFDELLNVKTFTKDSNFYRLRICKENYVLNTDEFFHIPFHKRGKVKTQRFSIPGFPSLYLGTSVYVCWEELNRPDINEFQGVRLNNVDEIKVIDLSPPKSTETSPYELYKYLMIWPLVLACSVKVKNIEDDFKPEYIIPQLLLQWVRERDDIDGISYQTTHIDFSNSVSKGEFLNIAIPVKEIKTRGLCKVLKQKFKMTYANSIQLDQCSTGGATFISSIDDTILLDSKIQQIELVKGRVFPYSDSIFGGFERTLGFMPTNQIK